MFFCISLSLSTFFVIFNYSKFNDYTLFLKDLIIKRKERVVKVKEKDGCQKEKKSCIYFE